MPMLLCLLFILLKIERSASFFTSGSLNRLGGFSFFQCAEITCLSARRVVSSNDFTQKTSNLISSGVKSAPSEKSDGLKSLEVSRDNERDLSPALGQILSRVKTEVTPLLDAAKLALDLSFQSNVEAEDIVRLCDEIDACTDEMPETKTLAEKWEIREKAMRFGRRNMLVTMMKEDYGAYVATASFLSNRIPRLDLPNVQDVPYPDTRAADASVTDEYGSLLVADCSLQSVEFQDSLLDKLLLGIFRDLVEKNTGGVRSDKPGIDGLLEQGRTFMLQEGQTPEAQHQMVYDTLKGLMTPFLPPFYRIFMSGIFPNVGTKLDGKQFGPWFYAPWLTTMVTPTFFGFLVGPSQPNKRKDGNAGGLLVEKCKFLQESGCKGLCLHQCKIPAQNFFREELGLPLTVSPNFDTQECQWSFGEVPLSPEDDPSFPKGCLVGCESRKALAGKPSVEACM